jgi:transposase-like protein
LANITEAERQLKVFANKWMINIQRSPKSGKLIGQGCRRFFEYPENILRMTYTTNAAEALHRSLRKTTKTKGAIINDEALLKLLYLTLMTSEKKRKRKARDRPKITSRLRREFGKRINQYLE